MNTQPYKRLLTYWYSLIIYDLEVEFTKKYIQSWKLHEQMDGAARSGKQNIVEGSDILKTSVKTGIKLTNVAKASIEELIGDIEDFIRQRKLKMWDKNDPRVLEIRSKYSKIVSNLSNLGSIGDEKWELPDDPEETANLLLTLCHIATYLLNKQVDALEHKLITEGGYTEKLYNLRQDFRKSLK
ncbi:four helix bundle protein [Candidatus Amesbacteria bacterium]|nr:four helix bundle protein [Candidatus Amesbacteria bacterium]